MNDKEVSTIVSGILAEALTTLPKITAAELHAKCADQIGNMPLAQFRIAFSKWISDSTDPNYIPGYEARLGRVGGIYKKGSANATSSNNEAAPKVKLDAAVVISKIQEALKTEPRITAGDLYVQMNLADVTEAQFRTQLNELFNEGALSDFETRKGPRGGIYLRGSDSEKWTPEVEGEDDTESSSGFAVQISPTLKIVHSDDRNWTIQKLSGETWMNKAYHPDLTGCIRSVVKHAVNGEFKLTKTVVQLKDLASVIQQMENRIMAQLEKAIQQ